LAENGHEVLTQLENQRFDLILMDIQMPGMDGVETARRIRSYTGPLYDARIPIIAFTAYSAEDLSSDIQIFDGFMQKPIKVPALLELLNTVISKSR
jgi:CheY-like chemotaxis protein